MLLDRTVCHDAQTHLWDRESADETAVNVCLHITLRNRDGDVEGIRLWHGVMVNSVVCLHITLRNTGEGRRLWHGVMVNSAVCLHITLRNTGGDIEGSRL
jgi:hypothetical protein